VRDDPIYGGLGNTLGDEAPKDMIPEEDKLEARL